MRPFRARPLFVAGTAALLATALAGCGGSGSGSSSTDASVSPTESNSAGPGATTLDGVSLAGTTFTSTAVSGHTLVGDSTVKVTFTDDTLSVNAGCNTQFGAWAVTGDQMAWTGPGASTMMACDQALMDQDTWLAGLFTDGAQASLDGATLVLTSGAVVLHLEAASAASLADVLGRTWTLQGIVTGDSVSSVPQGVVRTPSLVVAADGTTALDTGCNTGGTTVTVEGETLAFAPSFLTQIGCEAPTSEVETTVLTVLDGSADEVSWDGTTLTVTKGEQGLTFGVK